MGSANEGPWHFFSQVHSQPTRPEEENMVMAKDQSWLSFSGPLPDAYIGLNGVTFHVHKRCVASRSAKLARVLQESSRVDLSTEIPADEETLRLVMEFCYGRFDIHLTDENAVPLACAASYLEMTEEQRTKNLLNKTLIFITTRILPHWNETVRAFKTMRPMLLPYAQNLGLVRACLKSISEKASADPNVILGDNPITTGTSEKANVKDCRRKLFLIEDLTVLPLPLFELVVSALHSCSSDIENAYIECCVYRYAKRWIDHHAFLSEETVPSVFNMDRASQREVIETVEKLIPTDRKNRSGDDTTLPVKLLFQLLRAAMFLEASHQCRSGFEARIGKQLPEASVQDLCLPSYGYAKETKYNIKCAIRILNHYSWTSMTNISELEAVSETVEDYLAEVATDENLRKDEFVAILQFLVTVLDTNRGRPHDGVYRAVDMYLDAHEFLIDNEREYICRFLDCRRLSVEASDHAARSERLPPRTVAQVVFVDQLRIRQAIGEFRAQDRDIVEEAGAAEATTTEENDEEDEGEESMAEIEGRVGNLKIEKSGCGELEEKKDKARGWKLYWKEIKDVFVCKNAKAVACNNCQVINKTAVS